jgi:hypothetical protein
MTDAAPIAGAGARMRERRSQIWYRETNEHYVEPAWCSERLFEVEAFSGAVHDPCCGLGTIPEAARRAGLTASASDLVDRGYGRARIEDFFGSTERQDNIVCNPPFKVASQFVLHGLTLTSRKIAIIFPIARLNAAHWTAETPLWRVWLLSPRPSMPPGHVIAAGRKPGGGKVDFCWLVFERGHQGPVELRWLHRDGGSA